MAIFYRERLIVWNTTTWNHVEVTVPETEIYRVSWVGNNEFITISDSGAWLGTGIQAYGNIPRLWNADDGTLEHEFGVLGVQADVALVDDRWLIATSDNEELRAYYEDNPGDNLLRLENAQLLDLNVSAGVIQLATVIADGNSNTIQVSELNSGEELLRTSGSQYTKSGHFLANGQFLLINQYDNLGELWKLEDQERFPDLNIDRQDYLQVHVAWSPATMCAAATTYGENDPTLSAIIYLLDLSTGQQIITLEGHRQGGYVYRTAWNTNGQLLASSEDNTILIWQGT